jgi:hypothetical protein
MYTREYEVTLRATITKTVRIRTSEASEVASVAVDRFIVSPDDELDDLEVVDIELYEGDDDER